VESTPASLAARLAATVAGAQADVSGGGRFARATVDAPPEAWVALVMAARDELGCDFFDWLSAVDELDAGLRVVAHVWSTTGRYGVLLRTRVPRETPVLDSIIGVYPGAAWPERETFEMFAIRFAGHPDLRPLLLPPGFEGHPLRKDFVLASRVAKAWPGAVEPGEPAGSGAARRAPLRPPGVPDSS
jgi:NADH-quinone oxidoreductase subunit C